MSDSENAAIARRWFEEVWNQRSGEESADRTASSDATQALNGFEILAAAQFLPVRASLLEAFPDLRVSIVEILACGTDVVVRWEASGTSRGAALSLQPSHRHVHFHGITWLRLEDGRLVEGWDSWNFGSLLHELTN